MPLPLVAVGIGAVLLQIAGSLVGQVLISLGVGYVTFQGMDIALTWIRDYFMQAAGGLPAGAVGLLGVLKVGTSFSIISSAIAIRMALSGVRAGISKRMVLK